jgi:hypothetical protein
VMFFPDGIAGVYNKYKYKLKFLSKFIDTESKPNAGKGVEA